MKTNTILLIVAIVVGMAGGGGAYSYMKAQNASFPVLIATVDIPAGQSLTNSNCTYELFPVKFSSLGDRVVTAGNIALVAGRPAKVNIAANEPVLLSYFDPDKPKRVIFEQLLEPEDRAITIPVNAQNSVANTIEPGDYVDILATFRIGSGGVGGAVMPVEQTPSSGGEPPSTSASSSASAPNPLDSLLGTPTQSAQAEQKASEGAASGPGVANQLQPLPTRGTVTRTILQNVYVLGVGQNFLPSRYMVQGSSGYSYSNITVKVSIEEAQMLTFAQEALGAQWTLMLRNQSKRDVVSVPDMDFERFRKFDGTKRVKPVSEPGGVPVSGPSEAEGKLQKEETENK